MGRCPGIFRQNLVVFWAKKRRKSVDRCPGIFASFLFYMTKNREGPGIFVSFLFYMAKKREGPGKWSFLTAFVSPIF